MSSLTKQLKLIKKNKVQKSGKVRKRRLRTRGTTPAFPIHKPSNTPGPEAVRQISQAKSEAKVEGEAAVARIALKSMRIGGTQSAVERLSGKPDPRAQ